MFRHALLPYFIQVRIGMLAFNLAFSSTASALKPWKLLPMAYRCQLLLFRLKHPRQSSADLAFENRPTNWFVRASSAKPAAKRMESN
jgi:hypothetical protein